MDETMNTAPESTTSTESEQTAENTETVEPETTPQDEESSEEISAQESVTGAATEGVDEQPPAPFLTVRYNHEDKGLSQEEAATWAQKGMRYDKLYGKLDYLAALQDTTPDALADGLIAAQEASYRAELSERFGEDDGAVIEDMMALYRNRQKEKYDKVIADRKASAEQAAQQKEVSLNTRLAEEFSTMKGEFPELTDYSSLPVEVKKAAANGMPLEYAYLKYGHTESKKAAAAQESAEKAAKISTGSMAGEADTKTDDERRYLSALWGK